MWTSFASGATLGPYFQPILLLTVDARLVTPRLFCHRIRQILDNQYLVTERLGLTLLQKARGTSASTLVIGQVRRMPAIYESIWGRHVGVWGVDADTSILNFAPSALHDHLAYPWSIIRNDMLMIMIIIKLVGRDAYLGESNVRLSLVGFC